MNNFRKNMLQEEKMELQKESGENGSNNTTSLATATTDFGSIEASSSTSSIPSTNTL